MAGKKTALISATFSILLILVLSVPMPIVNMVYSIKGQDEPCNKEHHSMGLSLTDFLFWQAIAQFINVGLMALMFLWALMMFGCCHDIESGFIATWLGTRPIRLVMLCSGLFITAWTIVGFVILVTDDIDCLHDGVSIGVLTLINFILLFIHGTPCQIVYSKRIVVFVEPSQD